MTIRVIVAGVLAAVGVGFSLSAVVGIVRMPDVYCRIQCSGKALTLGSLPILLAVAVAKGPISPYGGRALLVGALLLVMNPTASHALARAAYKSGVPMWSGAVLDQARPGGASPDTGPPSDG